jgi:transposase
MALQVGFSRRTTIHAGVGVDEGQILTLPLREAWSRRRLLTHTHARSLATLIEEVVMNIRYRVELSEVERGELRAMLSGGKHAARKLKRAQILLAADAEVSDEALAISLDVGGSTVSRVKRRFVEGGLERALNEEPRPGAARKLTGKEEALLVATACASPPEGRARWTLELLAGEMMRLTKHASLSRETVRRRLAENALKPWRQKMWCIPRVNGEFVARMEDVLDLYAETPDPKRPVVCFDESPTQLIGEVRRPIPPEPGHMARFDYEYRRAGTVNLFVRLDAHRPWRKVTITQQRTALDFARCMRELVEVLPASRADPGGARQSLDAYARLALRSLLGRGGTSHLASAGVPLHPQACQLAEHGRD